MGPIDLLKQQHREVEALFDRIRTSEGKDRIALCGKLAEDLTVHAQLEEQIFYPEAKRRGMDELIDKATFEHAQVKEQVSLLLGLKRNDPRIMETVSRIETMVRKHVEEEERVVFPMLQEREPAAELQTLGEQMTRTEDDLRQQDLLQIAEAYPAAE